MQTQTHKTAKKLFNFGRIYLGPPRWLLLEDFFVKKLKPKRIDNAGTVQSGQNPPNSSE
jgi:hypothetical protein